MCLCLFCFLGEGRASPVGCKRKLSPNFSRWLTPQTRLFSTACADLLGRPKSSGPTNPRPALPQRPAKVRRVRRPARGGPAEQCSTLGLCLLGGLVCQGRWPVAGQVKSASLKRIQPVLGPNMSCFKTKSAPNIICGCQGVDLSHGLQVISVCFEFLRANRSLASEKSFFDGKTWVPHRMGVQQNRSGLFLSNFGLPRVGPLEQVLHGNRDP